MILADLIASLYAEPNADAYIGDASHAAEHADLDEGGCARALAIADMAAAEADAVRGSIEDDFEDDALEEVETSCRRLAILFLCAAREAEVARLKLKSEDVT